jgi:hypothetical protein
MHPNPGHEIGWAMHNGIEAVLMTGVLTPLGPVPMLDEANPEATARYRLDGAQIGPQELGDSQSIEVVLTGYCELHWCAALPTGGEEALYVLERAGDRLEAGIGPCQGVVHPAPSAEETAALRRCLAAGRCSEADLQTLWD